LDKFDKQIIQLLKKNARISVSSISRDINLSRPAVTERINKLEAAGIIKGYQVILAEPDEEKKISVWFEMGFNGNLCSTRIPDILDVPEIKLCHGVSGDTDLLIYAEVDRMERLKEIRIFLENVEGLAQLKTHVIMKEWLNEKFS